MLDASPFFQMIELDEVNSTNSYLAGYRPPRPTDITLVTAEYQTAGRGQTGNSWESERSQNLLFSLLLHPHSLPAAQMFVLSEAIALAIRGAIISFLNVKSVRNRPSALDVTVKWPNDIYVNQKKLAGILIESRTTQNNGFKVVIGTGINVITSNSLSNQKDISAITLDQVCNKYISRNELAIKLINEYRKLFSYFEKHGFSLLRSEWNSHDLFYGCEIKLVDKISGKTIANGIERGVNDIGSLIIENPKGMQETFLIGDLSLRL